MSTTIKKTVGRISDEQFANLVKNSTSVRQMIIEAGWKMAGGTYAMVHKRIRRQKLDASHFLGRGWNAGGVSANRKPVEEFLHENCFSITSARLKQKLYDAGLKSKVCEECGITEWNGKPAPLQLDHENGDSSDNRLDNLRILCANCHALTPTHSGKNRGAGRGTRTPTSLNART